MDENQALGVQPIGKLLVKFAVPCVTGLLIGALYNIVDQIFIGNSSLGYLGNAATGISFPIICIANAFAWCVGDGAASYLSICSGRQDSESAHKCVGTGLTSTAIISVILTIICLIFNEPLMRLFGASDQTLELAVNYFRIIALFFPAYLMFNVMNSMIRADGSPNYAMIALLIGAGLNIILDPICIFILDWGIEGAAIATVVGQVISFVISAYYFKKPKSFKLSKQSFIINYPMLKNLVTLGGSTFIIQISLAIMTLLSNVMLYKYGSLSIYGSDIPISVFSIQTKVYSIVTNIAVGIALGGQPILGYNYGARKYDRVKKTYNLILLYTMIVSIISTIIFIFCPQIIIGIFGKQNALYMEFAVKCFRLSLCLCFITSYIKISSIFFQAIGKPLEAMIASIIRDAFCFVGFTIILCNVFEMTKPGNGIFGILLASPLSDIVAGIVVTVITARFFKKLGNENVVEVEDIKIEASHPGTIITIAREHGTRGKQIGELVAKKLNVPFYCEDLAAIIAKESGLAEEFVENDYNDKSEILHQSYLGTNLAQQGIIAQEKVLQKIADNGACVIAGRAANHVLNNYPNVVKVFLYANEEYRIQNIQEMYGDSPKEAHQHMLRSDESRSLYYRNITGNEWRDIKNYDICLDASIGKEATADIIVKYLQNHNTTI